MKLDVWELRSSKPNQWLRFIYTAVNYLSGSSDSGNAEAWFSWLKRYTFEVSDWWILMHGFVSLGFVRKYISVNKFLLVMR